jgi:hypothetical protein
MPVMTWQEHAARSLYMLHFEWKGAHVLEPAPLVETEAMLRFNCACCNGSAWVAWRPAIEQGAEPDELIAEVERLVNERSKAAAKA